jgi:hypothetical protein
MEKIHLEKVVEVVVSTGKWSLRMTSGLSCFSLLRANERLLLRRQVRVIGKSRPLWPRANGLHLLIQYLE